MLKIIPHKANLQTIRHAKSMPKRVLSGVQRAFLEIKKDLKKNTIKEMRKKKSGQIYITYTGRGGKRLKRPRKHTASRPGEMPAIFTGALSKSLGYEVKYGVILKYGANTKYASYHELNNDRSYLLRSIRNDRRNIKKELYENIEKAIRKQKAKRAKKK